MKYSVALLLMIILGFLSCAESKLLTNNQSIRTIDAQSDYTSYRVNETWYHGRWSISSDIAHDTLVFNSFSDDSEFIFKTDKDSITLLLDQNQCQDFNVNLNGQIAHTIICSEKIEIPELRFDRKNQRSDLSIKYEIQHPYLDSLADLYPIAFEKNANEVDKVLDVLHWTRSQWEHDGNKSPSKSDAITILNEVSQGDRFPCFAYAIVLRDQLKIQGFPSRTVYLKTQNAATSQSPPGHVATEVFLPEMKKWIFIDAQFNAMPSINGVPLNAVEFQDAIRENLNELKFLSRGSVPKLQYVDFVYPYMFYFDTTLDNRKSPKKRFTVENKKQLMLVPKDAPNLKRINFWNSDIDYCIYTNSLKDFYASPIFQ